MILTLDLEFTLISSAISCFVRPHLNDFLEWSHENFEEVLLFTTVPSNRVIEIQRHLFELGEVNSIFHDLQQVEWPRKGLKDLTYVNCQWSNVIMVDDLLDHYAIPHQREQWIGIKAFDPRDPDEELPKLAKKLERKLLLRKPS